MARFRGLLVALPMLAFSGAAYSASLLDVMGDLTSNSPRVLAAAADYDAADQRVSETWRKAWTPQMDAQYSQGFQKYTKPNPTRNHPGYDARNGSIKVTQQVYDFGKSGAAVEEANKVAQQAILSREAVIQGLLLESLTAYLSVQKAEETLEFAKRSEINIIKQTELENALVDAGKGYASNVLQAKAQLAAASARKVRSEGALDVAKARVEAVFGEFGHLVSYTEKVAIPLADLPISLEDAKKTALDSNRQILIGRMRSMSLAERATSVQAREFLPKIQIVGEGKTTVNSDGTDGYARDRKIQLQAVYPINLGLSGLASVKAASKDVLASTYRETETKNLVMEQVVIAWRNLETAQQNRDNIQNQVNINQQFLDIARKEQQAGRRNLLDVLTAETSMINAQSDLVTTEYDIAIAAFTLLQATGKLNNSQLRIAGLRDLSSPQFTDLPEPLGKDPMAEIIERAPMQEAVATVKTDGKLVVKEEFSSLANLGKAVRSREEATVPVQHQVEPAESAVNVKEEAAAVPVQQQAEPAESAVNVKEEAAVPVQHQVEPAESAVNVREEAAVPGAFTDVFSKIGGFVTKISDELLKPLPDDVVAKAQTDVVTSVQEAD